MISVKIENLWKEYRLGLIGRGTLASDLQSFYAKLRGREDPNTKLDLMGEAGHGRIKEKRFFALRGIDLEIEQGDVVGIIGKNGAGKSTLFKILSRITKPTHGSVKTRGRTSSLLEVGTGFHPELTGRENIYLNGAILGMRRKEIGRKFDQIIDFSGIEEFVDTPVKRYSSGMYVRLAFAVAAHLEPDILIIDEVLAVGDAEFQEKCLGKMKEVSGEGRTVLFVSHQMNTIESLCKRGIILEEGKVAFQSDSISQVVRRYLVGNKSEAEEIPRWDNGSEQNKNPYFFPRTLALVDENGEPLPFSNRNDRDFYVRVSFDVRVADPSMVFGIDIYDENGAPVFVTNHPDAYGADVPRIPQGRNEAIVKIPKHFLNEGTYTVKLVASLYKRSWLVNPFEDDVQFRFQISGGLSRSPYWQDRRGGAVAPIFEWEVKSEKL